MTIKASRSGRRTDALSTDRIVMAAIEILDAGGESALTFRSLTTRLSTGPGAIYHHVRDKNELLAAATSDLITRAMASLVEGSDPRQRIRAVALATFDLVSMHPWVGSQLSREPWQPALLPILEQIGEQLQALGVPEPAQFDCASALLNFILGLAGQYAAGARLIPRETDRTVFLTAIARQWSELNPVAYPFVHQLTTHVPEHDDRQQFLAGIDLILTGISAISPPPPQINQARQSKETAATRQDQSPGFESARG